jgi:hypothetical protein
MLTCEHDNESLNFGCNCISSVTINNINPLNAKLNPICHLLALLGAHLIFHFSRIRVKTTTVKDATK